MDVRIAVASASLGTGFSGLLYGLVKKQLQPGQTVVECGIPSREDPELLHARILRLFEGVPRPVALIGICLQPSPATIAALRNWGIPVVLIDEQAEGVSAVSTDSFSGGYLAGQHLARSGRRAPVVVSGEMHVNGGYNALQRVQGFAKACAEHHVAFSPDQTIEVHEYSRKDGVNAMTRLLGEGRKMDAIFSAAGDATALGLLTVARERGLPVPEEVAVVGYDDSPMAALATPPLTTVKQSALEMAAEALRLATTETEEILARPKRVLLQPKLVVRESA